MSETALLGKASLRLILPALLLWSVLLACDTGSQLFFKLGADGLADLPMGAEWAVRAVTSPWVLAAVGCYLGAFLSWLLILRQSDLSRAFPLSAVAYVTVLLASAVFLGERVDLTRWVGGAVIMLGVMVLGGDE
jgi:drug/metabolite transporter (DMT)-like permease